MFIGVDGTGAKDDTEYRQHMEGDGGWRKSFVKRIYYETREQKAYFRGPTWHGFEVPGIVRGVVRQILIYHRTGDHKVFLAGWSRGAAICVLVAQELLKNPQFQGNIDCLALFDAVDRAAGHPDVIPRNVTKAYHALRDPAVRSWEGNSAHLPEGLVPFGNTATKAELPNVLEMKRFYATHSGVGGLPFKGDTPTTLGLERTTSFGFIPDVKIVEKPTITQKQDIIASDMVHQWMWERIRRHGMVP